ncbi:MAG TPA: PH domain-containing protein [Gemmatimonadales bacterium]
MRTRFALAPMCPLIRRLTLVMAALPVVFLVAGIVGARALLIPAMLVLLIYAWVWARFRPTAFVVHPDRLEVIWPLKRRRIPRGEISSVRVVDRRVLRQDVGWGMRVGAGGLWGGFGWLWTSRRGIVQMYVSRLDRFVWIERGRERPWLITPERPEEFVRSLLA